MIKFIDLFAGMGGIRLGLEQALEVKGLSGQVILSSEIKAHAIKSYKSHFKCDKVLGDIKGINENDIEDFDILLAGFPCQAFSYAGNQLGFNDTRGTMFFEVHRILESKRPRGFILENVEGLVTHDKGRTFKVILDKLESLGYKVSYKVLDSLDFGMAQSRKRIYIVGSLEHKINLDGFDKKSQSLKDIIEYDVPPIETDFTKKLLSHFKIEDTYGKQIRDKRGGAMNIHSWEFGLKGEVTKEESELLSQLLKARRNKKWSEVYGIKYMDGVPLTLEMISTFSSITDLEELTRMLENLTSLGYLKKEHPRDLINNKRIPIESLPLGYNIVTGKLSFEYNKILDPNGFTPTLVATDMKKLGVPIGGGIRPLTKKESLRLCGYPDDYCGLDELTDSQIYDLIGNTVCVPVIKQIALRLIDTIDF